MSFAEFRLPSSWRGFEHLYETVHHGCGSNNGLPMMMEREGANLGTIALIDSLLPDAINEPRLVRVATLTNTQGGSGVGAVITVIAETLEDKKPAVAKGNHGIVLREPGDTRPIIDYLMAKTSSATLRGKPANLTLEQIAGLAVKRLDGWRVPKIPEPEQFNLA